MRPAGKNLPDIKISLFIASLCEAAINAETKQRMINSKKQLQKLLKSVVVTLLSFHQSIEINSLQLNCDENSILKIKA